MDYQKLQSDPAQFRSALLIDVDGHPVRFGDVIEPWQESDFEKLDPACRQVVGQDAEGPLRFFYERPRGHSKTSDLAIVATWLLFASRRQIRGFGAAVDQSQARLLRDQIDTIVRMNSWLQNILKVDQFKVANTRTGSTFSILTSDGPSSYGILPDFLIVDEFSHHARRDLFDPLFSSAAKRKTCLAVIITNAGFSDSWQWELREKIRQDPSWCFSRLNGPVASWITQDRLEEQRRLLPRIAYERLWENNWTTGSGDALLSEDVDRAVVLSGKLDKPERGWSYVAGLDLGLRRDFSALAVVGIDCGWSEEIPKKKRRLTSTQEAMIEAGIVDEPEEDQPEYISHIGSGRLKLVQLLAWKPPKAGKLDIEQIENAIIRLDKLFRMHIVADVWQIAFLVERLAKRGLRIETIDFTGQVLKNMASATSDAFSETRLSLFPDEGLIRELKSLRIVERNYGFRLQSTRNEFGHGDRSTALSLALLQARNNNVLTTRPPGDRLLVFP